MIAIVFTVLGFLIMVWQSAQSRPEFFRAPGVRGGPARGGRRRGLAGRGDRSLGGAATRASDPTEAPSSGGGRWTLAVGSRLRTSGDSALDRVRLRGRTGRSGGDRLRIDPGGPGEEYRRVWRAGHRRGGPAGAAAGVEVEVVLAVEERPDALLAVASEREARMIVVGTYGEAPLAERSWARPRTSSCTCPRCRCWSSAGWQARAGHVVPLCTKRHKRRSTFWRLWPLHRRRPRPYLARAERIPLVDRQRGNGRDSQQAERATQLWNGAARARRHRRRTSTLSPRFASTASASTSATWSRCANSTSTSAGGSSSPCSGPAAAARRRRCGWSPASRSRPRGGS